MTDTYDAIIVGSGAAGGIVAAVLAEAGKRVLLLERGRAMTYRDVSRDHLRNHRLSLYGHNTGPALDGNPRLFTDAKGTTRPVRPHEGGYHNNAVAVGGGTLVYAGQAWRFMEKDFRMASTYGVPAGSSLADWPLAYDDLEPYYQQAEWEIGVCGDASANAFAAPRQRGYPMPALPPNPERDILLAGARRLGWNTFPVPMLINSVPYAGRPACVQCGACVGFACPSDGKNGTQNTVIPRALATRNCTLITNANAARIDTDDRGNVVGVSYFVEDEAGAIRSASARSKVVISSCGAIESARLLLNSATPLHPQGLGNEFDHVGRNLQGHYYPGAFGLFEQNTFDNLGPGATLATCQFNHGNQSAGIIGGGMLANEFIRLPIIFWRGHLPPGLPKWGLANKQHMRQNYTRTIHVTGPVQDIPSPNARVTLAPDLLDRFGLPVAHLSGTTHSQTLHTADYLRHKAIDWLTASGAAQTWSYPMTRFLSGGQHQAGTCRMGHDPKASVCDAWGRVHGHDNLYVIDASLHVTNGGFNPVLTIMALAYRCAEKLAKEM